jgi:hypothetical protein
MIKIINNNPELIKNYISSHGHTNIIITKEMIEELSSGKCALIDVEGEYTVLLHHEDYKQNIDNYKDEIKLEPFGNNIKNKDKIKFMQDRIDEIDKLSDAIKNMK